MRRKTIKRWEKKIQVVYDSFRDIPHTTNPKEPLPFEQDISRMNWGIIGRKNDHSLDFSNIGQIKQKMIEWGVRELVWFITMKKGGFFVVFLSKSKMKIGLKNVEKMTIKYKLWSGMGNVGTIIISK